jgi:DNA-directed RNA polymerase specialized sigma24 family protein
MREDLVQESFLMLAENAEKIAAREWARGYVWCWIRGAQLSYIAHTRGPVKIRGENLKKGAVYTVDYALMDNTISAEAAISPTIPGRQSPWPVVRKHCNYRQRMLFWKVYHHGKTVSEAAAELGIRRGGAAQTQIEGLKNIRLKRRPKRDNKLLLRCLGYPGGVAEVAAIEGITPKCLRERLARGWRPERRRS